MDYRLKQMLDAEFSKETSPVLDVVVMQLIPLLFIGADFQKLVWNALLKIPYGTTVSYGEIPRMISRPSSIRAVANANGVNAISIFAHATV